MTYLDRLWAYVQVRLGRRIPPNSFIPLLDSNGTDNGVVIGHDDATRDVLLPEILPWATVDTGSHGGMISPFFADQLASAAGIIHSAIRSRQLLQVVGSPEVLAGLRDGSLSGMRSSGLMLGGVVKTSSRRLVVQLRFAPATARPVAGPLAVWQILHAVAGVVHLQRINARLDELQSGIEHLTIRHQARICGQIMSATEALRELSKQHAITGTFTTRMAMRLAFAERDIDASLAELELLTQGFRDRVREVAGKTDEPPGSAAMSRVLKESEESGTDAKLLTAATQASMLAAEWSLRYDLEHAPQYASAGWQKIQNAIGRANEHAALLDSLNELHQRSRKSHVDGSLFRRILDALRGRSVDEIPPVALGEGSSDGGGAPSVFVWQDEGRRTRCVVVDVRVQRNDGIGHAPSA